VERRDELTDKQAAAWLAELKKTYGEPDVETLPGSQWSWGAETDVLLTFTQDNHSADDMSANVVLVHAPTYEAATNYVRVWEREHPEQAQAAGEQS
jgi:hypothetical protein